MSKWFCKKRGDLTVCLDIELTPELIADGIEREKEHKEAMARKKLDEKIRSKCPYYINGYKCTERPKLEHRCCMPKCYAFPPKVQLCYFFKKMFSK
jgi:hypothetical protein